MFHNYSERVSSGLITSKINMYQPDTNGKIYESASDLMYKN
jgi:hypothetical protein